MSESPAPTGTDTVVLSEEELALLREYRSRRAVDQDVPAPAAPQPAPDTGAAEESSSRRRAKASGRRRRDRNGSESSSNSSSSPRSDSSSRSSSEERRRRRRHSKRKRTRSSSRSSSESHDDRRRRSDKRRRRDDTRDAPPPPPAFHGLEALKALREQFPKDRSVRSLHLGIPRSVNLPPSEVPTEVDVRNFFQTYGQVARVSSHAAAGYYFVEFVTRPMAEAAYVGTAPMKYVAGVPLRITWAKSVPKDASTVIDLAAISGGEEGKGHSAGVPAPPPYTEAFRGGGSGARQGGVRASTAAPAQYTGSTPAANNGRVDTLAELSSKGSTSLNKTNRTVICFSSTKEAPLQTTVEHLYQIAGSYGEIVNFVEVPNRKQIYIVYMNEASVAIAVGLLQDSYLAKGIKVTAL